MLNNEKAVSVEVPVTIGGDRALGQWVSNLDGPPRGFVCSSIKIFLYYILCISPKHRPEEREILSAKMSTVDYSKFKKLGMESGAIRDSQIKAASNAFSSRAGHKARLNHDEDYWCSKMMCSERQPQWLEVTFGKITYETQSRKKNGLNVY